MCILERNAKFVLRHALTSSEHKQEPWILSPGSPGLESGVLCLDGFFGVRHKLPTVYGSSQNELEHLLFENFSFYVPASRLLRRHLGVNKARSEGVDLCRVPGARRTTKRRRPLDSGFGTSTRRVRDIIQLCAGSQSRKTPEAQLIAHLMCPQLLFGMLFVSLDDTGF